LTPHNWGRRSDGNVVTSNISVTLLVAVTAVAQAIKITLVIDNDTRLKNQKYSLVHYQRKSHNELFTIHV
jgi:hypothetical protein